MPRPLTNKQCRTIVPDNETVVLFCERLRHGVKLTERERQALWQELTAQVRLKVNRYYGRYNRSHTGCNHEWSNIPKYPGKVAANFDRDTERVILLLEFIKAVPERDVRWCFAVWRRRFAEFEAMVDMSIAGFTRPPLSRNTHPDVVRWVKARAIHRKAKQLGITSLDVINSMDIGPKAKDNLRRLCVEHREAVMRNYTTSYATLADDSSCYEEPEELSNLLGDADLAVFNNQGNGNSRLHSTLVVGNLGAKWNQ